jgi:hypothetical protein
MPVLYGQQGQEKIISPAPFVSIGTQIERFDDGRVKRYLFVITLKGRMLVAKGGLLDASGVSTNDLLTLNAAGGTNVSGNSRQSNLQQKIGQLLNLFKPPVPLNETARTSLQITPWDASGSTSSIVCYPRVKGIDIPEGPWTDFFEYTINLEADFIKVGSNTIGLDNEDDIGVEEEWNIEPDENLRTYTLTHTASAQATTRWVTAQNKMVPGFEIARAAVLRKTGGDESFGDNAIKASNPAGRVKIDNVAAQMSYFGLGDSSIQVYNATRSIQSNETAGRFAVTEKWTLTDLSVVNPDALGASGSSGLIPALEEYTVQMRDNADSAVVTVSVDGTITGLRTSTDTAFVSPSIRYDAAKAKMDQLLANNYAHIRTRAAQRTTVTLALKPIQTTIGHNKVAGTITYNLEFSSKPVPGSIPNVRMIDVNYTDNGGTQTYAAIDVLGRINGPVYQNLGSSTKKTRDITVDLTISAVDGVAPRPARNTVVAYMSSIGLVPTAGNVFLDKVTEAFNPFTGKYQLSITYAYGD